MNLRRYLLSCPNWRRRFKYMRLFPGRLEGEHTLEPYERRKDKIKWVETGFELCEDGISMMSPSIRITDVLRMRLPLRRVPFVEKS